MSPISLSNGTHNGMPLTEYSANPSATPTGRTRTSSLLPEACLLPDGHPDVRSILTYGEYLNNNR